MKKYLRKTFILFTAFTMFLLCACSKVDKNYGEKKEENPQKENSSVVSIPEIKSTDTVMPLYFDISLYDEENYSKEYLGEDFKYNITVDGTNLKLPVKYSEIEKSGWKLAESEPYNEESTVLAGKQLKVHLINEYGSMLDCVFYNDSKSSKPLKKCMLVTFEIEENKLIAPDTAYGQFWINGVSNLSAVTDVIEYLGPPSHFYAIAENNYYLDYFRTKDNKRSGITVYIDTVKDCVTKITVSDYE
ncbi:MAG: hypothetical protein MJ091_00090 [Clostridia bacterium]|nr:hypothetical protein [Clostridia bacterium]